MLHFWFEILSPGLLGFIITQHLHLDYVPPGTNTREEIIIGGNPVYLSLGSYIDNPVGTLEKSFKIQILHTLHNLAILLMALSVLFTPVPNSILLINSDTKILHFRIIHWTVPLRDLQMNMIIKMPMYVIPKLN